jgi:hypothetical protein
MAKSSSIDGEWLWCTAPFPVLTLLKDEAKPPRSIADYKLPSIDDIKKNVLIARGVEVFAFSELAVTKEDVQPVLGWRSIQKTMFSRFPASNTSRSGDFSGAARCAAIAMRT